MVFCVLLAPFTPLIARVPPPIEKSADGKQNEFLGPVLQNENANQVSPTIENDCSFTGLNVEQIEPIPEPVRVKFAKKKDDGLLLVRFRLPEGTQPIIENAVSRRLQAMKMTVNAANMRTELDRLKTSSKARIEIAPYLLLEGFETVKQTKRTRAQAIFYRHFQEYFAAEHKSAALRTLSAWKQYERQWRFNNPSQETKALFYPSAPYSKFEPPQNPLDLGPKGINAINEILTPSLANAMPELGLPRGGNTQAVLSALRGIGFAGTTVGLLMLFSGLGATAIAAANGAGLTVTAAMNAALRAAQLTGAIAAHVTWASSMSTIAATLGGVAATAAMAILIVLPFVQMAIMALVDLVKSNKFKKGLEDNVNKYDKLPDLNKLLFSPTESSFRLCYKLCRAGYSGSGVICRKDCPAGYKDQGLTCQKINVIKREGYNRGRGTAPTRARYSRGRGTRPTSARYYRGRSTTPTYNRRTRKRTCPSDRYKSGGRCYKKCRSGYRGSGNYCVKTTSSCGSKVKVGGLCYSKCRSGYRGAGTSCEAVRTTCGNKQNVAGLCYPACKQGFLTEGINCRKPCPQGYKPVGGSCRLINSKASVIRKETYTRGTGVKGDCSTVDVRESLRTAVSLYLLKMMIADGEDGYSRIPIIANPISSNRPNSSSVFYRADWEGKYR
jgi:hypothetical protein